MIKNTKKIIYFLLAGMVFFAAGFGLTFLFRDQEQVIITSTIENQTIENTLFYVTNNNDMNERFATISVDRLNELFEAHDTDVTELEMLGKEIHGLMEEITNSVNSVYDDLHDDMEWKDFMPLSEEYYQHFKNLRVLRDIDRDIYYHLYIKSRDYVRFYDKLPRAGTGDGKIELIYEEPSHPGLYKYYHALKESNILGKMIESINGLFYFERNHEIKFIEGQEINAWYDRSPKEIAVHYELIDYVYNKLLTLELNAVSEAETKLVDVIFFIVIHELGHALIDIFDLQHIGREEDVADHLSIVLMVELIGQEHPDLVEILFTAPLFFSYLMEDHTSYLEKLEEAGEEETKDSWSYWVYSDLHSLDFQRMLDLLSLIHGIKPVETEYLVSSDPDANFRLFEKTANNSPDIYLDTSNFWYNALYPHLR